MLLHVLALLVVDANNCSHDCSHNCSHNFSHKCDYDFHEDDNRLNLTVY